MTFQESIKHLRDRETVFRFGLIFGVFLLAIAAVTAGFLLQEQKAQRKVMETDERRRLELLGKVSERNIKSIAYDLIFLSNHPQLHRWLTSADRRHRADLSRTCLEFSEDAGVYDQIRFIDASGMERIRINGGSAPAIVAQTDLQNKGSRYYFRDTLKLSPGQVFVSPLDLNVENGRVEHPLKPVIRFGMPVQGVDGSRKGVVILNYLGGKLLADLDQAAGPGAGTAMMLNEAGYWAKGMHPEDEWGFMFADRKNRTMAIRHPAAWGRITARGQGQFSDESGLYTFTTVRPLGYGMRGVSAAPRGPASGSDPAGGFHWKLVSFVPAEVLTALPLVILKTWSPYVGLLLFAVFAVSAGISIAVTRRIAIGCELRESEATLRSIFRAAPAGIGMVRSRRFVQVNERFSELTGYSGEELLGKSARMLYIDDGEYAYVGREKYRQIAESGTGTVETRMRRKNGRIIDVLLSSTPVDPGDLSSGVTFTALDITGRKQVEKELRHTSDTLASILTSTTEYAIVATDLNLTIIHYNPTAEKLFGYPREEALGLSVYHIHERHEIPPVMLDRALSAVEARGKFEFEIPHRDQRGNLRTLASTMMPLIAGEAITGFIIFSRDVTKLKEMETQLAQANKMEAMGTLAGGVAHDFNNILSAIMGYAQLIRMKGGQEEKTLRYLEQILTACGRATGLVQQILTFTRQGKPEKRPIDITIAIKEALKLLRASIPVTIEIRQQIPPAPGAVLADPVQIHQVMMNLCTNASHAMETAGGILEVTLQKVPLERDCEIGGENLSAGAYLEIVTADTGEGMASNVLSRIFDPYFTTRKAGEGTGMGLATVHGIVKDHGGAITVESTIGSGSSFRILLPLTDDAQTEKKAASPTYPTGNERILLVDDEAVLADIGQRMLASLGYRAESLTDPQKALARFRKEPESFHMLITDMTMPEMTGEALIREVKAIRPEIPVLICTGFSRQMTPEKAEALGIDGFLMKPLKLSGLSQTVREILDRTSTASRGSGH